MIQAYERAVCQGMEHDIVVRFVPDVADKAAMIDGIERLFAPAAEIEGVHAVCVRRACVERENRHDAMIVMTMEEALPRFDASQIHHVWKRDYARFAADKTIFDCRGEER